MTAADDISAVILAAGLSSRMGDFKPLLELGKASALERSVRLFQDMGIASPLVVTGHRSDEVEAAALALGAMPVLNPEYEQGMLSSVLAGISALPESSKAFFLLPVDIPLVRPDTPRRLLRAWQDGRGDVIYPVFAGQRGHPPLIARGLIAGLPEWQGPYGLRGYLEKKAQQPLNIPVADQLMLLDMDRPEDFQAFQARVHRLGVPSPAECLALLEEVLGLDKGLVAHCVMVARVALALGRALNERGTGLDLALIAAGGLLHDAAKGQPDHAGAAAAMLRDMGWDPVAPLAAAHVNMDIDPASPISEAELVHLADKLVKGDAVQPLEKRFTDKLAKYGDNGQASRAIQKRWQNAWLMQERVEQSLGAGLAETLQPVVDGKDDWPGDLFTPAR